uniref:EF-hand domain-containing protein n=1 Tax=Strongyloides stercoralis TaxID=6248 RepID=A0A0K0DU02_STRER
MASIPMNDINSEENHIQTFSFEQESNSDKLEWLKIFNELDKEKTGKIPKSDLQKRLYRRNYLNLRSHQLQTLINSVDQNRDEYIDLFEFCMLMAKAKNDYYRQALFYSSRFVLPPYQNKQKISYLHQYSLCPPPLFIVLICCINIGFFIFYDNQHLSGNPLILLAYPNHDVWRLFTYSLIHSSISHLINNLIILIVFGLPLELVHGSLRLGIIYIIGAIGGALLHFAYDPKYGLIGCSGAASAIMACHIANLFINWREMELKWFRLAFLILFTSSFVGISIYANITEPNHGISDMSHLGGAIAGLCMGVLLLKNLRVTNTERIIKWILFTLHMIFIVILFLNYMDVFSFQRHILKKDN